MIKRNNSGVTLQGRVRGALFGIAYGDAMGGPVEKLSAREIAEKYGRVTSIDHRWHRLDEEAVFRNGRTRGHGIITDDTLMTICLMEVYAEERRHLDAWDMAGPFVRKIAWEPRWIPELDRETVLIDRLFYPEKWIYHRLQLAACDPRQGGIGNMVNCGAAMYAAPIGMVNACNPKGAYDEAISFMSGHQQSYGLEAAGVFAACVAEAFRPDAKVDDIIRIARTLAKDGTRVAIDAACKIALSYAGSECDYQSIVLALQEAMLPFSPMGDDVQHGPEKAGLATAAYQPSRLLSIEELPLALAFIILNNGDFFGSIEDAVNSGRDTDSIGIMVGAILGAMLGEETADDQILKRLNTTNRLDLYATADSFSSAAIDVFQADLEQQRVRQQNLSDILWDAGRLDD